MTTTAAEHFPSPPRVAPVVLASSWEWFNHPLFWVGQHWVSAARLVGFIACTLLGVFLSGLVNSERLDGWLHRHGLERGFFSVVRLTLSVALLVGLLLLGLTLAGLPISWRSRIPGLGMSLVQLLRLAVLVAAAFWAGSAVRRFAMRRFLRRSGLDEGTQFAIAKFVGYLAVAAGLFLAVQSTGLDLAALNVFAGAVGVGIGLGLQGITSNFISGLIILFERPIRLGDRIKVGDVVGQVTEIRARYSTVTTNDHIALLVPNSKLIENAVVNWSHGDPRVRFRIPVGVAYGSDVAKVSALLVNVAKAHPAALPKPEPTVFFDGFGDSALNFELVVWTLQMAKAPRRFRSDLNFGIEKALREHGVEIPFPQRVVYHRREEDRDGTVPNGHGGPRRTASPDVVPPGARNDPESDE